MSDQTVTWYDWSRTLSFNADITMVVTIRGRGKTYGIRKAALDEYIKRGYRFVEVVRYKAELSEIMAGYFDRLALRDEYAEYEFKAEGRKGCMRKRGDKDWSTACYFVTLTEAQNAKKRTYTNVRKIIYDEALLEPSSFTRYLPREYQALTNVVDTVTREVAGTDHARPHLYLLGNSCDLTNPFFVAWGIDRVPDFGYTWHAHGTVLLHYEEPGLWGINKAEQTLAGRMASTSDEGVTALQNEFRIGAADDIYDKPAAAKFWVGLVYRGHKFGVWIDWGDGYYYVTKKIPSDAARVYSLTRLDNTANRLVARRATPAMQAILDAYYERLLRFESIGLREGLLDALQAFGVR